MGAKANMQQEKMMNEKALYQQKKQAQLDAWKADVDKLKAKASGASADTQLALNKQIEVLEGTIGEGEAKLGRIADASEEAWALIKESGESSWGLMKAAFSDAAARFK